MTFSFFFFLINLGREHAFVIGIKEAISFLCSSYEMNDIFMPWEPHHLLIYYNLTPYSEASVIATKGLFESWPYFFLTLLGLKDELLPVSLLLVYNTVGLGSKQSMPCCWTLRNKLTYSVHMNSQHHVRKVSSVISHKHKHNTYVFYTHTYTHTN